MLRQGDALLLVDVQRDFLPGGSLAVPRGDQVIAVLNRCVARFLACGLPVFATRDWHPPDHCSFHAQGGPWPPHCVAGSAGAELALDLPATTGIISKAIEPGRDAYSGFDGTALEPSLKQLGVARIFVGGLATDYCVLHTVLDARRLGFEVWVIEDGVRAVDLKPGDGARALETMRRAGARTIATGAPA